MPVSSDSSSASNPSFPFRCLRCGSLLEARFDQSGRPARCPTCDARFTVPMVDETSGQALSDADPGDDGELPTPVHAYAASGDKAPLIVRQSDDRQLIRCRRCNHDNAIDADRCQRCGMPFTLEGAEPGGPRAWRDLKKRVFLLIVVAIIAIVFAVLLLAPVYR